MSFRDNQAQSCQQKHTHAGVKKGVAGRGSKGYDPKSPTFVKATRRFFFGGSWILSLSFPFSPSSPLACWLAGRAADAEAGEKYDWSPPSTLAAGVSGGSPPRFLGTVGVLTQGRLTFVTIGVTAGVPVLDELWCGIVEVELESQIGKE